MEKNEVTLKLKEILIEILNLNLEPDDINDNSPLFGTDEDPGIFEDSLAVLEVSSALIAEFDIDASIFNEESFLTVETLSETLYKEIQSIAS